MPEVFDKRPLKVFLCHASADKPKVRELYRTLRRRGVQPWLDAENLIPGQNWEIEIPKALLSSDAIIICLSPNSVDKEGYVQKEIKFALDKALEMPEGRIFLIPAKLEECDLPFSLRQYQAVNLYEKEGYARLMKALKLRASQLERNTVELPKEGEIISEIKKVVEEKKSVEPKEEKPETKIFELSHEVLSQGVDVDSNTTNVDKQEMPELVKPEEKHIETPKAKVEKPEPKKTKSPRKINTAIIVALIGLAGTIIAALLGSPVIEKWFSVLPIPTISTTPTVTLTSQSVIQAQTTEPAQGSEALIATITLTKTLTPPLTSLPSETPHPINYHVGYLVNNSVYTTTLAGETSKVLGELPHFSGYNRGYFAVSNNGQYISYSKNGIIYVLNTLTSEETPLFSSPYQREYRNLAWAPDGNYLFAAVTDPYLTREYLISKMDATLT